MAPKKAPKKAAKKAPGKHVPQKAAKDARRTFEHMGRVQALSPLTGSEATTLSQLTALSDAAFQAQRYKEAADLLRAAEHLSFAALQQDRQETVAADLRQEIGEELQRLAERAVEHAAHHPVPAGVQALRKRFSQDATRAFKSGACRAALEFARGAEALAHVHDLGSAVLPAPSSTERLKA